MANVKCEFCGDTAKCPPSAHCPATWFYAEIDVEGEADCVVVVACSKECALAMWSKGPGDATEVDDG